MKTKYHRKHKAAHPTGSCFWMNVTTDNKERREHAIKMALTTPAKWMNMMELLVKPSNKEEVSTSPWSPLQRRPTIGMLVLLR